MSFQRIENGTAVLLPILFPIGSMETSQEMI